MSVYRSIFSSFTKLRISHPIYLHLGRGAFYKAKYARTSNSPFRQRSPSNPNFESDLNTSDYASQRNQFRTDSDLQQLIGSLNNKGYGAYKQLQDYSFRFPQFQLDFTYVQGDPHAPPSSLRAFISHQTANFPNYLYKNNIRKTAFADHLNRHFLETLKKQNISDTDSPHWRGPRGGFWRILKPSPYVLDRSSVTVNDDGIIVNFQVALPAFGRSIAASSCQYAIVQKLPFLIQSSFMSSSHEIQNIKNFVECVEDQDALRNMLGNGNDYVAFIADGSILPRAAGDSMLPLAHAIPWTSPKSLACQFTLPNRGVVTGTGLKKGITLILGGGFHGKSTLLDSLLLGVYNKTPHDGREFVVSLPSACEARSEDGRCLHSVALQPFIHSLPFLNPTCVETQNASGSTSLAASIQEAMELRSQLLLLDEDVCATNFLIRDERIAQLVPQDPITPFVQCIQSLAQTTSFILVVGGCGDYLNVADTVICMDQYQPKDITLEAKQLARPSLQPSSLSYQVPSPRVITPPSHLAFRKIKWNVANAHLAMSDSTHWDLNAVSSLVEIGQMRLLVDVFDWIVNISKTKPSMPLIELYHELQKTDIKTILGSRYNSGAHTLPRSIDVIRALNRLRLLRISPSRSNNA